MRRAMLAAATLACGLSVGWFAATEAAPARKEILAITPERVRWFTPPYYKDGRERAQLLGDSGRGGRWVDRVKMPAGARVLAHTHPHDEQVTVISGTWYVGVGEKFDAAALQPCPAGSFVVIPAGLPHFVAAKDGPVIVQLSGVGRFGTDPVEK